MYGKFKISFNTLKFLAEAKGKELIEFNYNYYTLFISAKSFDIYDFDVYLKIFNDNLTDK